ncbi:phospholipase D family protein [Dyella sp.]|uniref:phospholipase D family protein n=1 Tax=Dyella sp. TaxID=1869338 RepID=UPI002ED481F6
MFLVGKGYSKAIKDLAVSDETVDMAIAFWGKGANDVLLGAAVGKRRIICNLLSGGTNPSVIGELMKHTNVEVKQLSNLHAKVLLGASYGIIGSANFSANGLGFEGDEVGHWIEAGYRVEDQAHLEQARDWFKTQWDSAETVDDDMIREAYLRWKPHRAGRPKPATSNSNRFAIDNSNWMTFLDRGIKLILWRSVPTRAERKLEQADREQRQLSRSMGAKAHRKASISLDYYHNWQSYLSRDLSDRYIDIQYKKRGGTVCHGARRPLAGGHKTYPGGMVMDVMEATDGLFGMSLKGKEREAFAMLIKPVLDSHFISWSKKQNKDYSSSVGAVISLDRVLRYRFGSAGRAEYGNPMFNWLLQCGCMVSDFLGMRCVAIDTTTPQVRIGLGERALRYKDEPALRRVSVLLYLAGPNVVCGVFLPKEEARQFGFPADRHTGKDRSWIQWPIEKTPAVLFRLVEAGMPRFLAKCKTSTIETSNLRWPAAGATSPQLPMPPTQSMSKQGPR